jgi:hypothetical protein
LEGSANIAAVKAGPKGHVAAEAVSDTFTDEQQLLRSWRP